MTLSRSSRESGNIVGPVLSRQEKEWMDNHQLSPPGHAAIKRHGKRGLG